MHLEKAWDIVLRVSGTSPIVVECGIAHIAPITETFAKFPLKLGYACFQIFFNLSYAISFLKFYGNFYLDVPNRPTNITFYKIKFRIFI